MPAVREATNRVKIERERLSRIPIDPALTVLQGDLMCMTASGNATQLVTDASGGSFIGMAETTNPIETIGSHSFLADSGNPRINVIQKGLVEVIVLLAHTYKPFDKVYATANPQTVTHTGSNAVGFVDPGYGQLGRPFAVGDLIKIWLQVPDAYSAT